jgi:uncharacterized surface protein with fasciclin (FAS1) repeats
MLRAPGYKKLNLHPTAKRKRHYTTHLRKVVPFKVKHTNPHRTMKNILTLAIVALLAGTATQRSFAADATDKQTVVAIAAGNPDFSTLVAAVKAAGLAETLSGEGPFTVFAPTNEAFAKLPAGTVETLLKPENKAKLAGILTYHVVAGKVMAADVKTSKVKTVQGGELDVVVKDGAVTVDGAKVVKTDIVGSNGVIHVIDTVVLPKE